MLEQKMYSDVFRVNFNIRDYHPHRPHPKIIMRDYQAKLMKPLLTPKMTRMQICFRRRAGKDCLAFSSVLAWCMGFRYDPKKNEYYLVNHSSTIFYLALETKQAAQILGEKSGITLDDLSTIAFTDLIPKHLNPKVNRQTNSLSFDTLLPGGRSSVIFGDVKTAATKRGLNCSGVVVTEAMLCTYEQIDDLLTALEPSIAKVRGLGVVLVSTAFYGSYYQWYDDLRHKRIQGAENWIISHKTCYDLIDPKTGEIYDKEYVEDMKKGSDPLKFSQEFLCLPTVPKGCLYRHEFDAYQNHEREFKEGKQKQSRLMADDEVNHDLPFIMAMDIGSANSAIVIAQCVDGIPHLVDAAYRPHTSMETILKDMLEKWCKNPDVQHQIYLPHDSKIGQAFDRQTPLEQAQKLVDSLKTPTGDDVWAYVGYLKRDSDAMMKHEHGKLLFKKARFMRSTKNTLFSTLAEVVMIEEGYRSTLKKNDALHLADALGYLGRALVESGNLKLN